MNAREKLIVKYISDLKEKCNVNPEMDLLRKVTVGCGPSIYNSDSSTVSATSESELKTIKNNFLIKKLGLSVNDKLDEGINNIPGLKSMEWNRLIWPGWISLIPG